MPTRIVLQGGDSLVVADPVQQVTKTLSSNGDAFATLERPGEGVPDVVVNSAHVLYLEHFEEQSSFLDSSEYIDIPD